MTTLPTNRIKLANAHSVLPIHKATLPIGDVMRLQLRANIAGFNLSRCLLQRTNHA
jgi:hypothetical protein